MVLEYSHVFVANRDTYLAVDDSYLDSLTGKASGTQLVDLHHSLINSEEIRSGCESRSGVVGIDNRPSPSNRGDVDKRDLNEIIGIHAQHAGKRGDLSLDIEG